MPIFPAIFFWFLYRFLLISLNLAQFAVFIVVILSWFPQSNGNFVIFLRRLTAPLFALARRVTPRIGILDFSPLIVLFSLELLRWAVVSFFAYFSLV